MEDLLDHQLKEDDLIFDVECFTDIDELIKPEDLLEWYSEDNHITTNTNNLLIMNTEQNNNIINNNLINETSIVNTQTVQYSTLTLPAVPSNSIRISFSDMFLNTLNSGDFQHVQDFFQTFMTRNCCFTSTQEFPSILQIPNQLIVKGPIFYAHYLLGLNIMYPDMVLKVHNSRTIYDSKTKQTKVIMGVEYNLTKTLHIPYELWVPPEHLLNELHTARDVYHLTSLLQRSHISEQQLNSTTTHPTTGTATSTVTNTTTNHSNKTHNSTTTTSYTTTPPRATTTTGVKKETKRKRTIENQTGEKGLTNTSNSTRTKITTNTTNTSAGTITSTTSNSSHNTGSTSGSNHSTTASSTIYVPTNYITQVHDAAVVLPEPLRLTVVGQLEIVLDESQHVVSMNMRAFLA